MIVYKSGDILKEVKSLDNDIIVHAVNCKGVWGAGFAKQLKKEYISSFHEYVSVCDELGEAATGEGFISSENVASLFVSEGYGRFKSSPEDIFYFLPIALDEVVRSTRVKNFHSPKLCSGLFGVPWVEVETIINEIVEENDISWTVWEI